MSVLVFLVYVFSAGGQRLTFSFFILEAECERRFVSEFLAQLLSPFVKLEMGLHQNLFLFFFEGIVVDVALDVSRSKNLGMQPSVEKYINPANLFSAGALEDDAAGNFILVSVETPGRRI